MLNNKPDHIDTLSMSSSNISNEIVAPMVVPPDGGWGWIVVLVGFFCGVVQNGLVYCCYLLRHPMSADLAVDPGLITTLASTFSGVGTLGGIVACSAGNHWGFRPVMIIGSIVLSLSLASGFILEDMIYFFIIIGVIGGTAAGFVFVASLLPAGFYFDKKRSVAMGLVSCGSGFGAILMPQITKVVMTRYGWRLTFLFHAGLVGLLTFLGLLIRPLKPVGVVLPPRESWASILTRGDSRSIALDTITIADSTSAGNRMSQPTDLQNIQDTDAVSRRTAAAQALPPGSVSTVGSASIENKVPHPTISQRIQDMDAISIQVNPSMSPTVVTRLRELSQPRLLHPSASQTTSILIEQEDELARLPWYKCGCCRRRGRLPHRPLMRTDVLYTGSLRRLPEFTEKERDLEYHMTVTKVPNHFEMMQHITQTYTRWCCHNIWHGLRTLLDLSLLKSPTFVCLAICGFAEYVAFYLPYLYGKVHLEYLGHGDHATTLVSAIGLGNTIGRISSGVLITMFPKFGARMTTVITTFIAGLMAICNTLYSDIYFKLGCMIVYGFTAGFYAPLRSIIIVDFFGLNTLTPATGMMILFQGIGSFAGAPATEMILHITNDTDSPFYVTGVALIFASLMLLLMGITKKWEERQRKAS